MTSGSTKNTEGVAGAPGSGDLGAAGPAAEGTAPVEPASGSAGSNGARSVGAAPDAADPDGAGSVGAVPDAADPDGAAPLDPAPFDPARADEWTRAAVAAVAGAATIDVLTDLERRLLGKRSVLAEARAALSGMDPDDRRTVGAAIAAARAAVEQAVASRRAGLAAEARRVRIAAERLDLTEVQAAYGAPGLVPTPGVAVPSGWRQGRVHLVQRTRDALEDVFVGMGFTVADGPEVETDWYNFEALHMPPAHPARGMFDTFYLDLDPPETFLLRTHTSPVQIRLLQQVAPPVYAVMPGRCYRRETPDARHLPVFHQVEGLVVDEGITFADLAGTIETFTAAYFGDDIAARLRPAFFPFTEPSAEFEITCTICRGEGCRTCSGTGWVELGGCGMVDPAVFAAVGLDPERTSGFAFGFGIDRCAQMRHGIADMRVLLDNDLRLLRQA
jgi:phenylalanyl-tRNA synthetase alpha chain